MIAITVDDERPMLKALTDIVKASPDIKEVYDFSVCSAGFSSSKENSGRSSSGSVAGAGAG